MKIIKIILTILLPSFLQNNSYATAWLLKKNKTQIINHLSINNNAVPNFLINNNDVSNVYQALQYQLYAVHGITDKLNIGINVIADLPFMRGTEYRDFGASISEVFVRQQVIKKKFFTWSVEGTIGGSNLHRNSMINNAYFGTKQFIDAEIASNFGFSFLGNDDNFLKLKESKGHFINFSIAFRNRMVSDLSFTQQEIRLFLLYGFHFSEIFTVMFDAMKIFRIDNIGSIEQTISSYHIIKLTTKLVININENTSLVGGFLIDIYNNNEIATQNLGIGIFFGIWNSF